MTDQPFNHDGFWKAFFVTPDGALRWAPLIAIVAPSEPGRPQCFVWEHDCARDVADVPGFVEVMGTPDPAEKCQDSVRRSSAAEIAAWLEFYAELSRKRRDA